MLLGLGYWLVRVQVLGSKLDKDFHVFGRK